MATHPLLRWLPLFIARLSSCTTAQKAGQLYDHKLRPCPDRPNCVSSEPDTRQLIPPLEFHSSQNEAWQQLITIIEELGGEVMQSDQTYIWATFSSPVFRFTDDLELRMAAPENRIHVRSGARIGYSDFGVNKKRVEKLRESFNQRLKNTSPG